MSFITQLWYIRMLCSLFYLLKITSADSTDWKWVLSNHTLGLQTDLFCKKYDNILLGQGVIIKEWPGVSVLQLGFVLLFSPFLGVKVQLQECELVYKLWWHALNILEWHNWINLLLWRMLNMLNHMIFHHVILSSNLHLKVSSLI